MTSSTRNVKIGVCKVFFGGLDLGYTKGGVEVSVKTDTYKVNIDQFGKTSINEYLTSRDVTAKVPLAETTMENLVSTMPGASIVAVGGAKAAATVTITTNPTSGDTILVNGQTVTFKTLGTAILLNNEVDIGANATATALNLAVFLQKAPGLSNLVTGTSAAAVTTVTAKYHGTDGNLITLGTGTAGAKVTLSGTVLSGGTEPTSKSIAGGTGIGTDLLTIARELRFHPVALADSDKSDDFVMPLAATPGALNFAYKLDSERIYNVDFTGYPDSVTGLIFRVGL